MARSSDRGGAERCTFCEKVRAQVQSLIAGPPGIYICNECVEICNSILHEAKDATQIADELKISLSTVYKTLSTLEELALAEVDKFIISPEGKKIKLYRSRIGKVEITLDDLEPSLNLYSNTANPKSS